LLAPGVAARVVRAGLAGRRGHLRRPLTTATNTRERERLGCPRGTATEATHSWGRPSADAPIANLYHPRPTTSGWTR
jgi:hypothetical protein